MEKIYFSEIILVTKTQKLQDFKDWLKWHLDIIHVDHVVVFDNESNVNIKSICESDKRIEYHFVKGWPDQYNIYNNYINNKSKAWWVLPIDDDEFLYIGKKYNHDINTLILILQNKWKDMNKLSIGWVNMFSPDFIESRNNSLIDICTSYSYKACENLRSVWRQDNRWIKTIVKTTYKWDWAFDENGNEVNTGHNPTLRSKQYCFSYTENGDKLVGNVGKYETSTMNENLFLAHFQYKSNEEWIYKCKNRKSAASQNRFDKNKPGVYKKLYEYKQLFNNFNKMKELWNL